MPLRIVHRYTRADAQAEPEALWVFGDNAERWGLGGQAAALRGEPNAVGIATLQAPGRFWSDDTLAANCATIDADMAPLFDALRQGLTVVWPADGVGTGLARLEQHAPLTWAHLASRVAELKTLGGI